MPESQPAVSLLESLRARSAALRNADLPSRRPAAEVMRDIDRRLLSTFRWLDEALGHLDAIRPHARHRFEVDPVLTLVAPGYDGGFVSCRRCAIAGLDLIDRIELFYRMTGDTPLRFEIRQAAVAAMSERLRAVQLEFDYRIQHDERRALRHASFTVAPVVTASVLFCPDYHRSVVTVSLRNVDRLESVVLEFAPEAIGEPTLEDLVRLMLGESNVFLKRAPLARVGVRAGG